MRQGTALNENVSRRPVGRRETAPTRTKGD